jgi:hypothetical protein
MSLTLVFGVVVGLLAVEPVSDPVSVSVSASAHGPSAPQVFSVVPGTVGSPLGAAPKGGPARVVWTGFQMTDGGSRVFVQTTAEVRLDLVNDKGGVKMTLHNCRIHMRNNSRTLDTRFFTSPVQQVVVHQRRHDVELEIALNAPTQSTSRQETGADGSHFWVIDFAPPAKTAPTPGKSVSLK